MALKKKGQITKERLLEIGTRQMLEGSYESVGIQSITQEAELPKASFYYYFKSKEDFAKELFKTYMENYFQANAKFLQCQKDQENTPKKALQRIEMLYRKAYESHQHNDWKIPCLFMKIAVEVSSKSDAIRHVIRNGIEKIIALHEETVKEGIEDGSLKIPEDFSVPLLAELIFNQWKGAVLLSNIQRNGDALEHFFTFLDSLRGDK